LIVLRVLIDELSFIGVGWIVLLALLPLFPILLPRLADLLKAVSPYVERFQLGAVQVSFREARREPIALPSAGILASVPNDVAALSSGTAISDLVASLRGLRRLGGSPVVVIDLRDGGKWRLEKHKPWQ
jgi:predicted RecB family endonuclease